MEKRIKRVKYRPRRRDGNVGDSPGLINIAEDAMAPHINIFSYNDKELVTDTGKNIKVVLDQLKKCKNHTHWIQIKGLGDAKLLEDIG
ncbi:MAG: magnesium and cobalt transport protein CorA, partial [Mucilaginibacter sp.]